MWPSTSTMYTSVCCRRILSCIHSCISNEVIRGLCNSQAHISVFCRSAILPYSRPTLCIFDSPLVGNKISPHFHSRKTHSPLGTTFLLRVSKQIVGFDPRTVQPVAIRYTNYATWPTTILRRIVNKCLETLRTAYDVVERELQ
jgi:hypothetical protein